MKDYFAGLLEAIVIGIGTGCVFAIFPIVAYGFACLIAMFGYPVLGAIVGCVGFIMIIPIMVECADVTFDYLYGFFE